LVLCYQFQVRDDAKTVWAQVSVDRKTGKVVQAVDYYNEFSVNAILFPNRNPSDANAFATAVDPKRPQSFSFGMEQ